MGTVFTRRDGLVGQENEVIRTSSSSEVEIQGGVKLSLKEDSNGFVVMSYSTPQCSANRRTLPSVVESKISPLSSLQPSEARSKHFTEGLISDASISLLHSSEFHSINSSHRKAVASERRFGRSHHRRHSVETHSEETSVESTAVSEAQEAASMSTEIKPDQALNSTQVYTNHHSDYNNDCERKLTQCLNMRQFSPCCESDSEEPTSKCGGPLTGLEALTTKLNHYPIQTVSRKLVSSSSTLSMTSLSSMGSEREKFLYSSLTLHET